MMRFACQPGCTACCRGEGFVYLTEEDLKRAAKFLRMKPEEFERRYVFRTRNLRRLRAPRHARCPFLTGEGCSIHPAKPTQCRIFPFWPELVHSKREWKKAAKKCPGIGKGELVRIEVAREGAREMREAYPTFYP
jgi:Fe-S-cluster containining protein